MGKQHLMMKKKMAKMLMVAKLIYNPSSVAPGFKKKCFFITWRSINFKFND